MDVNQRGDLVLNKVPKGKVEGQVLSYLLSLRQDSSLEAISEKIKKTPAVLFKDISPNRALKIAADLRELGAVAVFSPYGAEGSFKPRAPISKPKKSGLPKTKKVSPRPEPKPNKWLRLVFLIFLLLLSLTLLVFEYFPLGFADLF